MAYPGYPAQPGPGGVDPLWGYFSAIAGQDGQIDANELQRCLSSAGQQYSKETCRIMITMLDVSSFACFAIQQCAGWMMGLK
jgi:hypothetical protein